MKNLPTQMLTAGDVAKEIGLTVQSIYAAEARGGIVSHCRTVGGITLFTREEVERFKRGREQRVSAREAVALG